MTELWRVTRLALLIHVERALNIPEQIRVGAANEVWLLWQGLDPRQMPEDVKRQTLTRHSYGTMLEYLARNGVPKDREELASVLVCTMHEVSERIASCSNPKSIGNTEQLVKART